MFPDQKYLSNYIMLSQQFMVWWGTENVISFLVLTILQQQLVFVSIISSYDVTVKLISTRLKKDNRLK